MADGLSRLWLISGLRRLWLEIIRWSLFRVNRVTLVVGRPHPVYPDQRTSSDRLGMSGWCQRTKSLRSSPLRGGKSRETRASREDGDSGVGVQRMVKHIKIICGRRPSHTANRIYQPTTQ